MRICRSIVLAAAITASSAAHAQQQPSPDALVAAKELTAVLSPDLVNQMSAAVTAQVWTKFETEMAKRVDQATIADLRNEFQNLITAFTQSAVQDVPAIYARYFTAEELRELLAFHRSPTGAKSMRLMPQVMGEYFATIMPRMEGFQRDVAARMGEVLRRHGYQP